MFSTSPHVPCALLAIIIQHYSGVFVLVSGLISLPDKNDILVLQNLTFNEWFHVIH
jgi:hypothetical protein